MKNIEDLEKSHEEATDYSSSLSHLPDEIILQILTKLIDLKTLCLCYLVSKRFSSIVLQVDVVSFTAPLLNSSNSNKNLSGDVASSVSPKKLFWSLVNGVVFKPLHLLRRMVVTPTRPLPPIISSFYGYSFQSAISFLIKFKGVKSLCVELPSSSHKGIDNGCLFRWKVKFGNRIESFQFLSPGSFRDTKGLHVTANDDEEEETELSNDLFKKKVHIAFQCLKDVIVRHRMSLYYIKVLPKLEEISIADSGKRGRLSLNGGKLVDVRNSMDSDAETLIPNRNPIEVPVRVSTCFVPELEMPVSGYVMKGITLVLMEMNDLQSGDDGFVISEAGFEDKEEAAYGEAVMEIMEKHKDRMKRLL